MKRIKISFSLMLTLLLVGMFSAVAFAAAPPTPNVYGTYSESGSITISKFINAAVSPTVDSYEFRIDSEAPITGVLPTDLELDRNKVKTQYTVELPAGTDSTTAHTVYVKAVNADGTSAEGSYTLKASEGPGTNANLTGTGDFNKAHSDGATHDQKVHGSYANNTNSCASCHQTHTGADTFLLFKNGTSATCDACHDGTLAAYDVKHDISNAGIFNQDGQVKTAGKSAHNVNTVNVAAAPGGDTAGSGSWTSEFTCASCHNPHGSDSDRLLVTDPMGWGTVNRTANELGTLYDNIDILTVADLATGLPVTKVSPTADYILVKTTVDTTKAPFLSNAKFTGVADTTPVLLTYKWDIKNAKYAVDYSLWLRSSLKFNAVAAKDSTNLKINYKEGYATGSDTTGVTSAQVAFGIAIDALENPATIGNMNYTTVDNRAYFDSNYAGKYIADSGNQMSKFCSACHNDYLSASHGQVTGTNTTAFRHITIGDGYSCVRCHFAHGSQAAAMKDSMDRNYLDLQLPVDLAMPEKGGEGYSQADAILNLTDQNASSALKRYVGMGACYGCHGKDVAGDDTSRSNMPADGKSTGARDDYFPINPDGEVPAEDK